MAQRINILWNNSFDYLCYVKYEGLAIVEPGLTAGRPLGR